MKWVENPPAVLVANQFNLSIFSQMWLAKQGVLDAEGTVNPGSIFSDNVVQVVTPSFLLLVFLEQLQFAVSVPHDQQQSLVTGKLGKLVQAAPHVPYSALGLNFYWHLIPEGEETSDMTVTTWGGQDPPRVRCAALILRPATASADSQQRNARRPKFPRLSRRLRPR